MRGTSVDTDWRTIQLFLTNDAVCEVEVDHNRPFVIRCNCKGYNRFTKCAHVKYVKEHMENNDGHYTINISADIDPMDAALSLDDAESFRHFIIKYGKVEVID